MPWVRTGDNAGTYPKLMVIAGYPGADARAINEVYGWFHRLAEVAASHVTDYVVNLGTASMFGGTRTKKLIGWCERSGLMTPLEIDGIPHWVLINDPDFIHMRTGEELAAERNNRADRRDTHLAVKVRLRDGDNCRYCGIQVKWTGRKSKRSAQLDHREHDGQPATADTMVVACTSCNTARQNSATWDTTHPVRPAPTYPKYSALTAGFLSNNGHEIEPNLAPDDMTPRSDTATATAPAPRAARAPRPETPAETSPETAANPVPSPFETSSAGSGRDGPGQTGTGTRGRSRSRGRRGRGRPGESNPSDDDLDQPAQPPALPCCAVPFTVTDPTTKTLLCLTCGSETTP